MHLNSKSKCNRRDYKVVCEPEGLSISSELNKVRCIFLKIFLMRQKIYDSSALMISSD